MDLVYFSTFTALLSILYNEGNKETKVIAMIGNKYNELTVVSLYDGRIYKDVAYNCICSCGTPTVATKDQLLHGRKKSCGCLRRKTPPNAHDLTDKRFGKLVARRRAGITEQGNALWECDCDCGNRATVISTLLVNGNTKSCGCAAVEHVKHARDVLERDMRIDGIVVPKLTQKVRSDSQTGHKGICRRIKRNREYYEAYITVDGKRKYLGSSPDLNVAIRMRQEAEEKYYKPTIQKWEAKKNEK